MKAVALTAAIVAGLALKAQATDPFVTLTGFSKVQSNSGIEVTVVEGQDYRIEAYAKRGSLDQLQIDQHGDTLVIDRRVSGLPGTLFTSGRRDQFVVTVAMPNLDGAEALSGSSMVATADGSAGFVAYAAHGASLEVSGLRAQMIDAEARSGASLILRGTCDAIDIAARSGALVSARALACDVVDADSRSGATVTAFARLAVNGDAQSGASLLVSGKPAAHDMQTGSGGSARLN